MSKSSKSSSEKDFTVFNARFAASIATVVENSHRNINASAVMYLVSNKFITMKVAIDALEAASNQIGYSFADEISMLTNNATVIKTGKTAAATKPKAEANSLEEIISFYGKALLSPALYINKYSSDVKSIDSISSVDVAVLYKKITETVADTTKKTTKGTRGEFIASNPKEVNKLINTYKNKSGEVSDDEASDDEVSDDEENASKPVANVRSSGTSKSAVNKNSVALSRNKSKSSSKAVQVDESDSESEEEVPKPTSKTVSKSKSKTASKSKVEEEVTKPTSKTSKSKSKSKVVPADSDSEAEEEVPKTASKSKSSSRSKPKDVPADSDSEDESGNSEVTTTKVVVKTKSVPIPTASDSESEEEVKPKTSKRSAVKQSKKVDTDDEDEEEFGADLETTLVKVTADGWETPLNKASPARVPTKEIVQSDEEEDEEEVQPTNASYYESSPSTQVIRSVGKTTRVNFNS